MDVIDQLCLTRWFGTPGLASCPHLTPIGVPRSLSISRILKFPGPDLNRFRWCIGFCTPVYNRIYVTRSALKTRRSHRPSRVHLPTFPPMQLDDHEYIRRSDNDSRSPCPALNALANHGILFVHLHPP